MEFRMMHVPYDMLILLELHAIEPYSVNPKFDGSICQSWLSKKSKETGYANIKAKRATATNPKLHISPCKRNPPFEDFEVGGC